MYPIGTKLGVSEFFYTHVGRYVGNGMVFHNHWRNGAEIITLAEFMNGKKVMVLDHGVQNIHTFLARVQEVLSARKQYHAFTNNCEHAVSYVRDGIAKSPQAVFWGISGLIALGVGLARSTK